MFTSEVLTSPPGFHYWPEWHGPLHRLWRKNPAYYWIIRRGSFIPATQSRRRHSLLVCAGSLWTSFPHSCIGLHARSPAGDRFGPYTVCGASRTPAFYVRSQGRFGRYTVWGELLALLHCTLAHRGDLGATQSAGGLPALLHCTLTHRGDLGLHSSFADELPALLHWFARRTGAI